MESTVEDATEETSSVHICTRIPARIHTRTDTRTHARARARTRMCAHKTHDSSKLFTLPARLHSRRSAASSTRRVADSLCRASSPTHHSYLCRHSFTSTSNANRFSFFSFFLSEKGTLSSRNKAIFSHSLWFFLSFSLSLFLSRNIIAFSEPRIMLSAKIVRDDYPRASPLRGALTFSHCQNYV